MLPGMFLSGYGAVREVAANESLDTETQLQKAASPQWLWPGCIQRPADQYHNSQATDTIMENLTLGPGPTLIWRDIHRQDSDHPVEANVASRAVEFLYESVTLDQRLTLGDVIKLLDACPTLREQVFRREFADELCTEARKGPLPQSQGSDPEETLGIEYLELCRSWGLDTASNTYSLLDRLDLHGVGYALASHVPDYGVKAGERINWSISLTPVRELLDLPLRLRHDVTITEDDLDAKAYGDTIARARCPDALLGQVIHGVLGELSFHGGPDRQKEFRNELLARKAEVDAGTAELIPSDAVFGEFDRPGFDTLFETLGGVPQGDVRAALRRIGDDEPVGAWLEQEFDGTVVVKAQYRNRHGREFRREFRAAGR